MKKSSQRLAIQARQSRLGFSVLIFCLFSLAFVSELVAQEYTFPEIKEIFLRERAQTGDLTLREARFGSIDDLILGTYPPLHPGTRGFYTFMIKKAIQEIKSENVTEGATIWQIYNHGFVVKTPSKTFGFDLYDYFGMNILDDLADILDAYFISHSHGDHYSQTLLYKMKARNKPTVGPAEWTNSTVSVKMDSGDTLTIAGLTVIAHYGLHSVPVRQFEVVTSEGLKFLHTGDNQTSETLPPVEDIDVMLLNSWINESGMTSWIEGIRIAINKMIPETTLPGHIIELGHLGGIIVPYRDVIAADNGALASDYYVLAWGERYHYDNTSNDSIPPNAVKNPNYSILVDTISFSWDLPQAALDGDTASFYRVVLNDTKDFLITNKVFFYADFRSELESVKVYSYDDCGNQSLTYSEIQELENIVYITFKVTVPEFTPSDDMIFISGTFNRWDPGPSQTGVDDMDHDLFMTWLGTSLGGYQWQITLPFTSGETIEYKYTRGSWNNVEKGSQGEDIPNHILIVPSENYTQEDTVATWTDISTAMEKKVKVSLYYDLDQNYPNPFNPVTMINYQLPMTSVVELSIYNLLGQKVATLVSEKRSAGAYKVEWDASEFASGIYLYRLEAAGYVETRKMVLMK